MNPPTENIGIRPIYLVSESQGSAEIGAFHLPDGEVLVFDQRPEIRLALGNLFGHDKIVSIDDAPREPLAPYGVSAVNQSCDPLRIQKRNICRGILAGREVADDLATIGGMTEQEFNDILLELP